MWEGCPHKESGEAGNENYVGDVYSLSREALGLGLLGWLWLRRGRHARLGKSRDLNYVVGLAHGQIYLEEEGHADYWTNEGGI